MENKQRELLLKWRKNIRTAKKSHFIMADKFRSIHFIFGVPIIILATFATTTIFITIFNNNILLNLMAGIISIISTILASLMTFFNYSQRSENHNKIARRYSILQRDIENIITFENIDGNVEKKLIQDLKNKIDKIDSVSLIIPNKIWDNVMKNIFLEEEYIYKEKKDV